ncbi:MAG TPA: CehA/McbA family metallohydrolase, partial [Mycobacteriales bacterium]|nr:CehA/McbA family metallohydrolase [Mycobacteriales bacterium]
MSPLSRRGLLKAGGLAVAATAFPLSRAYAQETGPQTVQLAGTAFGIGTYQYHPFTVPPGVNRLDVRIDKSGTAKTGLGIFDQRGAHYATLESPNGFRGIYGEERGEFFLATDAASQSFVPGPIEPGEWTVVVPVFTAQTPVPYVVTVTMSAVPAGQPFVLGRDLTVVSGEPGWYRGDLHAHTPESSDAWKSGSALTPPAWAQTCREIGLDYLALTDHNVVSQNFSIDDAAGEDVLLMAGEEMTNWFHGHATVSGMDPGQWYDWRQRPAGTPIDPVHEGRITDFLEAVRDTGAFVSAAHPLGATLAWQFFPEAAADPAARTDSLEVWTGPFQPDDQASVDAWDAMNRAGQRIVANGGSDLHGVENNNGFAAGTPTTVVHAAALSKPAIVEALKRGRSFVTRLPDGVEIYLSGELPDQRQIMGGTLYGAPTDVAEFEVVVRRAAGKRLVLLRDGVPFSTTTLASDDDLELRDVGRGA